MILTTPRNGSFNYWSGIEIESNQYNYTDISESIVSKVL